MSAWPSAVCASRTSPSSAIRHAERAERRLERRAPAVDAREDDADALRRDAAAQQREQLLADELERAARAGTFEEANRAVYRHRLRRHVGEQRSLEMRERRLRGFAHRAPAAPRCRPASRERSSAVRAQRREPRTARLVRQRDADVDARGERLEQRPLRAREVFEAVGEHRLAVPRVEIRLRAAQPRCAEAARGRSGRAGRARRGTPRRERDTSPSR